MSKELVAAQEADQNRKKSRKRKRLLLQPDADKSIKSGDNNLTKALGSPDYQTRDKVGSDSQGGGCNQAVANTVIMAGLIYWAAFCRIWNNFQQGNSAV